MWDFGLARLTGMLQWATALEKRLVKEDLLKRLAEASLQNYWHV